MKAFSGEARNRFSTAYSQILNRFKILLSQSNNMRVVVLHLVE